MKKIKKIFLWVFGIIVVAGLYLFFTLSPVIAQKLKSYKGSSDFKWSQVKHDLAKKTIFIVADNDGTEMFDLMAPFYLFNATGKANVYVVAEKKAPILLVNSLFILPHYSFSEVDSMHLAPDVVVIPNITVHLKTPPKQSSVSWIKKQVTSSTIVLAICDGSATAAATGLYDGKPITTHASDFKTLKKEFPKPVWIKDVSVTESGNLYSTAGVSNAVEGSLTVIKRLFGEESMQEVAREVRYPHPAIQMSHQSEVVGTGSIVRIVSKVLFQKNIKLGVLLNDKVNEFELASVLDTYARTFPSSLNTFSPNGAPMTSKYGLTLYPTGNIKDNAVNELHLLNPESLNSFVSKTFGLSNTVSYDPWSKKYPIDICLERIRSQYGEKFKNCVMLTLDYN